MEPLTYAADKLKGLGKAGHDYIDGLFHRHEKSARRNPIEILKRLQREAFSDLMKLRDRQDKVERVLSFYKTEKGSPFQESSTHVKGEVDLLGALLMMDNIDQHSSDALGRAGIRTGINSRLTFENTIGEKDSLVMEFVASQKEKGYLGDIFGSPLSLAKVFYHANFTDWISAVVIPVGGQCRDISIHTTPSLQGKGLTDVSSFGPPLLNQHNGSGIGLRVRKSNIIASLAQFVSGLGIQPGYNKIERCFSTFGQVICHLPRSTRLTLLGLLQVSKSSNHPVHLGALTIPISFSKHGSAIYPVIEASAPPMGVESIDTDEAFSNGSVALVLESELDEVTRVGGWIEMNKSNPKHVQWAVSISDDSEHSMGWGMSLSGMIGGPTEWDHFQVESYVKMNLGKRFCLKPGVAYVKDGSSRTMALMVRSNWSL